MENNIASGESVLYENFLSPFERSIPSYPPYVKSSASWFILLILFTFKKERVI